MMRPDFLLATGYARTDLTGFLRDIAGVIRPVELNFVWRPQLADPKDEMVLETAVNGGADALVTHNGPDFEQAAARFGIRVARPRDLLEGKHR